MIDTDKEALISLADAASFLPPLRAGRPVHPKTIRMWALRGYAGVKLETVKVGRARMTSRAAVRRFLEEVTHASARGERPQPRVTDDATKAALRERGLL